MSTIAVVTSHNDPAVNTDPELTLMAHVARKYYVGGQTKSEIAEQLALSRFKVARLLEGARDAAIVRFQIGIPGDVNLNLTRELHDAFGLRRAVVIDDVEDDEDLGKLFSRLGDATAMLLADAVREDDVVGIASTRTMMGLHEPSVAIPRCTFVQLTGELPRRDAADVISGIRSLTRASGGGAHVFYAPMVASSEHARDTYLAQPELLAAFDLFRRLDVFVTGVGEWRSTRSVIYDNLPVDARDEASRHGAICEMVGVPINRDGHTVHGSARRLVVAPDVEMLLEARERIGVVFDPVKAPAVKVTIDTGRINAIVTHRAMAEAMLAL